MPLPTPNPIDEGWLKRGTPVDPLGATSFECPTCGPSTEGQRYRVIMDGWGGVGAPYFIRPFLKRSSTAGKLGTRSEWAACDTCRAFVPQDESARASAVGLGLPNGFGVRS